MTSPLATRTLKILVIFMGVLILIFAALLAWGIARGFSSTQNADSDAPPLLTLAPDETLRSFSMDDGHITVHIERAGRQRIMTFRNREWQDVIIIRQEPP